MQISNEGKFYYVYDWRGKNMYIVDASGKDYHQLSNSQILGIADFRFIGIEKEFLIPIIPENKNIALRMN